MTTTIDIQPTGQAAALERVIEGGDLSQITPAERMVFYREVCHSLGLNPLTRPFLYIKLNGKLTLYATKDATEQLARIHKASIDLSAGSIIDSDTYVVRATASTDTRRVDATGVVSIARLTGESKANALMKAETKAARRAVLRLIGLGWLDETEVDSVPTAQSVSVDYQTGEIIDAPALPASPPAEGGLGVEFVQWLHENGKSIHDLAETIRARPVRGDLRAWSVERGLSTLGETKDALLSIWQSQRSPAPPPSAPEPPPRDERPVYSGDDDAAGYTQTGLPYKPMPTTQSAH